MKKDFTTTEMIKMWKLVKKEKEELCKNEDDAARHVNNAEECLCRA